MHRASSSKGSSRRCVSLWQMFLRFLQWHTDMVEERDFSEDYMTLCWLKERIVHKQLNELCNVSCTSTQLISIRGIRLHLNLKISCKDRQFNSPTTTKKNLISNMGTTLQKGKFKSTYVHFHGNALHLHPVWKITALRILLESAYETATFKSSREDVAFQGMPYKAISGKWRLAALNHVLVSPPDFHNVASQHFQKNQTPRSTFKHSKVRVWKVTRFWKPDPGPVSAFF